MNNFGEGLGTLNDAKDCGELKYVRVFLWDQKAIRENGQASKSRGQGLTNAFGTWNLMLPNAHRLIIQKFIRSGQAINKGGSRAGALTINNVEDTVEVFRCQFFFSFRSVLLVMSGIFVEHLFALHAQQPGRERGKVLNYAKIFGLMAGPF